MWRIMNIQAIQSHPKLYIYGSVENIRVFPFEYTCDVGNFLGETLHRRNVNN